MRIHHENETRIDIAGHLTNAFLEELLAVADRTVCWIGLSGDDGIEMHRSREIAAFFEKNREGSKRHLAVWSVPGERTTADLAAVCVRHGVAFHAVVEPVDGEGGETRVFLPTAGMADQVRAPAHGGRVDMEHVAGILRTVGADEMLRILELLRDPLALLPVGFLPDAEAVEAVRTILDVREAVAADDPYVSPFGARGGGLPVDGRSFGFRPERARPKSDG